MLSYKYHNLYNDMVGGSRPNISILKNIDLFSPRFTTILKPDVSIKLMEQYLNPLYGFVWACSSIIENIHFYPFEHNDVRKLVKSVYSNIDGNVKPIDDLYLSNNINSRMLGRYLANKYIHHVLLRDMYNYINTTQQCINKNNDINKLKSAIDNDNIKLSKFDPSSKKYKKSQEDGLKQKIQTSENKLSEMERKMDGYMKQLFPDIIFSENKFEHYDHLLNERIHVCQRKIDSYPQYKNEILNNHTKDFSDKKESFYVILSLVWWHATDKNGIADYYRGLNDGLKKYVVFSITAPFFLNYDLKKLNSKTASYYEKISYLYYNGKGSFDINEQEKTNIKNCKCSDDSCQYSDCGSSALRTFLRLWLLRDDDYDMNKLREKNADNMLVEFFSTFNNKDQTSDIRKLIFGDELTARDAWGLVVSNRPGVNYENHCKLNDGSDFHCELGGGFNNILNLIKLLLPDVTAVSDFNHGTIDDDYYMIIDDVDGEQDTLTFDFKTHVGAYSYQFNNEHFHIYKEHEESDVDYEIKDLRSLYLLSMGTGIDVAIKYHATLETITPYWYKFFDLRKPTILKMLCKSMHGEYPGTNVFNLSPELYNIMTKHIIDCLKKTETISQHIMLLPDLVNKNHVLDYYKCFFTVVEEEGKIVKLLKHPTLITNFNAVVGVNETILLENLTCLEIAKNITMTIDRPLPMLTHMSINNNKTQIIGVTLPSVETLYINNFTKKYNNTNNIMGNHYCDFEIHDIERLSELIPNIQTTEIGSNCDVQNLNNIMARHTKVDKCRLSQITNSKIETLEVKKLLKSSRTPRIDKLRNLIVYNTDFVVANLEVENKMGSQITIYSHMILDEYIELFYLTSDEISEILSGNFDIEKYEDKVGLNDSYLYDDIVDDIRIGYNAKDIMTAKYSDYQDLMYSGNNKYKDEYNNTVKNLTNETIKDFIISEAVEAKKALSMYDFKPLSDFK